MMTRQEEPSQALIRHKLQISALLFLGTIPGWFNGLYNPLLLKHPLYYWLAEIVTWVCIPILIYSYGIRNKYFTNKMLGFHTFIRGKKSVSKFIVTIFLFSIIIFILDQIIHGFSYSLIPIKYAKIHFDYSQVIPQGGHIKIIIVLYFAISAGMKEEFYYRGMARCLFKNDKLQILEYIFFSSIIFSSLHWEGGIHKLLNTFLFGVSSSCIYVFLSNIWPLIIGHFFVDLYRFS